MKPEAGESLPQSKPCAECGQPRDAYRHSAAAMDAGHDWRPEPPVAPLSPQKCAECGEGYGYFVHHNPKLTFHHQFRPVAPLSPEPTTNFDDFKPMPWDKVQGDGIHLCDGCGEIISTDSVMHIRRGNEPYPETYIYDPAYFHAKCVEPHPQDCQCLDCETFELADAEERVAIHVAGLAEDRTRQIRNRKAKPSSALPASPEPHRHDASCYGPPHLSTRHTIVCGKAAVEPSLEQLAREYWPIWVESLPLCDTTSTPRFPLAKCACGTYPDNLGPCLGYELGGNGRCPYCDHAQDCHRHAFLAFAAAFHRHQLERKP